MSKNYDHKAIEGAWQESGIYNWDENDENVFSIDTPPQDYKH